MDLYQLTSKRIENFRKKLISTDMDGAFITNRENRLYLSGFTGTSGFLLITGDKTLLLTDFRYVEQAAEQATHFEVIQYTGNVLQTVKELMDTNGIKTLGFENRDVTYDRYMELQHFLDGVRLMPLGTVIEELRRVKDPYELETIKSAVRIADEAFNHVLKFIKPGVKELELAAELEYHMKKLGATGTSFETIIASGKRSSLPHGVASLKKLEMGDPVTIDFGAYYEDYCSDMTRTVFLGEPEPEMKKIYNIVLQAQQQSAMGAVAGMRGKDVDQIAREFIYGKGYEKNFGHGLGHSVGLQIHEDPRLNPTGESILENGMVVTVEPGIYISGYGGVRIEDILVIQDDKPVTLTTSTKDMIIL